MDSIENFDHMNQSGQISWKWWLVMGILLFTGLGWVELFDWDELNFGESAREMILSGTWERVQVGYEPFWEKPPLFIWLQALHMKLFGISPMAARLPNALCGFLCLAYLNRFQRQWLPHSHSIPWPMVLCCAWLPFLYFRSGIIDPWFNFFMLLCILRLAKPASNHIKTGLEAGLWAGLAVLTKGPVGLLLPGLTALWMFFRHKELRLKLLQYAPFALLAFLLVSSVWYVPETLNHGTWFIRSFIAYQWELLKEPVAGHEQPFYYHPLVVFLGCFPFSLWAFPELWKTRRQPGPEAWLQSCFWMVLIVFSLVSTKIVHYSSMCWVPLSGLAWYKLNTSQTLTLSAAPWFKTNKVQGMGLWIFAGLLLLIPLAGMLRYHWMPYIPLDQYASASLQLSVDWNWHIFIPGVVFALGLLWWNRIPSQQLKRKVRGLSMLIPLVLWLVNGIVLPKIQAHSQGAAQTIFKEAANHQKLVVPVGYKTYAHFWFNAWTPKHRFRGKLPYSHDVLIITRMDRPLKEIWYPGWVLWKVHGPFLVYGYAGNDE